MLSFSDSGSGGVGSLGWLLLILWGLWLVVTISVVLLATLGHRRTRRAYVALLVIEGLLVALQTGASVWLAVNPGAAGASSNTNPVSLAIGLASGIGVPLAIFILLCLPRVRASFFNKAGSRIISG
jgi:hypothetical protein